MLLIRPLALSSKVGHVLVIGHAAMDARPPLHLRDPVHVLAQLPRGQPLDLPADDALDLHQQLADVCNVPAERGAEHIVEAVARLKVQTHHQVIQAVIDRDRDLGRRDNGGAVGVGTGAAIKDAAEAPLGHLLPDGAACRVETDVLKNSHDVSGKHLDEVIDSELVDEPRVPVVVQALDKQRYTIQVQLDAEQDTMAGIIPADPILVLHTRDCRALVDWLVG